MRIRLDNPQVSLNLPGVACHQALIIISVVARAFLRPRESLRSVRILHFLISTRQLTITNLLPARVAQGPQGIKIFRSH